MCVDRKLIYREFALKDLHIYIYIETTANKFVHRMTSLSIYYIYIPHLNYKSVLNERGMRKLILLVHQKQKPYRYSLWSILEN